MKKLVSLQRPAAWLLFQTATLLISLNVRALDIIDPTGVIYTNITESSRFGATWGATNLFNYNVTGVNPGDALPSTGLEYAKSGPGTAYVVFEVGSNYDVGSVFYAQRFGSTTGDNMQRMSIWTSTTTPFTAVDPGTPAQAVVALLPNTGVPIWREYFLTNTLTGRYFLLKLEQTTLSGNPGGKQMRLGQAPNAPIIGVQPASQTVYSGSTVALSVQAAGIGTLAYQWQSSPTGAGTFTNLSDIGNISGAHTANLMIANASAGTLDYQVVVTNANGAATSSIATVTVNTSAPFIVTDITPASLSQPAGYPFSFKVVVDGSRPLTYQWKKDGVNVVNSGRISGANSNILSFSAATNTDAGNYQLFVTNSIGDSASSQATLTVIPSLPVLDPTGVIYTGVSDSSHFSAGFVSANLFSQNMTGIAPGTLFSGSEYAKSGPGTAYVAFRVDTAYTMGSVFWGQRNGSGTGDNMQKMSIWTSTNSPFTAADPGTGAVAVINLAPNSGTSKWVEYFLSSNIVGQYFLLKLEQTTVTGNPGGSEMRFGLAQQAPAIGVQPTDVAAYDGNTVQFAVGATGAQPLRFRWQVSAAGAGSFTSLTDGANVSGSTNATLTLRNIPLTDFDYRVIVTNTFGNVTSDVAHLTVTTSGPQLLTDLTPLALQQPAGFAFTYSVQVTGSAPIVYQWFHNGAPLSDTSRVTGSHSNVLFVANAQSSDEGTYSLSISNAYGPAASSESSVTVSNGFGLYDGSAWSLNGGATMNGDALSITEAVNSQARTAFFRTPVSVGAFQAHFLYQDVSGGGADGAAFIVQNSTAGPAALGPGGGGFAYVGITPSVAVLLNIYSGAPGGRGIAFMTNGNTPEFSGTTYSNTAPLNLASGNPIDVTVRYALGVMTLTLVDSTAGTSYKTNVTINLPAVVGGTNAYIGFSGATGGINAQQQISNVSFINLARLSVQSAGSNVIISWPVASNEVVLKYATDLGATVWQNETATVTETNGIRQVTVPASAAPRFYTLGKP